MNGIRVFYYNVSIAELERKDHPQGVEKYKACPLIFSSERLISTVEAESIITEQEYHEWMDLAYARRANRAIHQILGYPDQFAHDPFIPEDLFFPELIQYADMTQEHRLLLQLDDSIGDVIDFPACGRKHLFCMLNRDLKARNFSRVWLDSD
jgi:uncharacterized protein YwqG